MSPFYLVQQAISSFFTAAQVFLCRGGASKNDTDLVRQITIIDKNIDKLISTGFMTKKDVIQDNKVTFSIKDIKLLKTSHDLFDLTLNMRKQLLASKLKVQSELLNCDKVQDFFTNAQSLATTWKDFCLFINGELDFFSNNGFAEVTKLCISGKSSPADTEASEV